MPSRKLRKHKQLKEMSKTAQDQKVEIESTGTSEAGRTNLTQVMKESQASKAR